MGKILLSKQARLVGLQVRGTKLDEATLYERCWEEVMKEGVPSEWRSSELFRSRVERGLVVNGNDFMSDDHVQQRFVVKQRVVVATFTELQTTLQNMCSSWRRIDSPGVLDFVVGRCSSCRRGQSSRTTSS